jgi:hypothetical protein
MREKDSRKQWSVVGGQWPVTGGHRSGDDPSVPAVLGRGEAPSPHKSCAAKPVTTEGTEDHRKHRGLQETRRVLILPESGKRASYNPL